MRHRKAGRKFDRAGDERKALLRGLVGDLLRHERLRTTEAKVVRIALIRAVVHDGSLDGDAAEGKALSKTGVYVQLEAVIGS